MSQEEQGKKTSPTEKLPATDDKAPVPAKPTALSDADLDNVAGGITVLIGDYQQLGPADSKLSGPARALKK